MGGIHPCGASPEGHRKRERETAKGREEREGGMREPTEHERDIERDTEKDVERDTERDSGKGKEGELRETNLRLACGSRRPVGATAACALAASCSVLKATNPIRFS